MTGYSLFDLTFETLEIRNFLSFGNNTTAIDLTIGPSVLITGQNLDLGGANGVGKTTIINAICFALFNNPFSKISLKRLINNTNAEKDTLMEVRLTFSKGGKQYEIYRCRGSSTNIEIYCDGVDITLDSVSENDKLIVEIIGISYELFTNIIVFAGGAEPFLEKSIGDQRKLIEELFNITVLSEKAKKLKDKIKLTESDINIQEAVIREQQNAVTRYNKQVADAEARILKWEADKEDSIVRMKAQLALIEGIDFEAERCNHKALKGVQDHLQKLKSEEKELTRERTKLNNELEKTKKELSHLRDAKCPYCLQQFADANIKISELESYQNEIEDAIQRLLATINSSAELIETSQQEESKLKKEIKHPNIEALLKIKNEADSLHNKLSETEKSENPHLSAYEALLGETVKNVDTKKLDELKTKLEHQQFLLKLLTDKNSFIRRKIINKTIPFLNACLNKNTTELGLPHVVNFDDDMSCTVSEYGRNLDFGNLSNGEKKRLNMAMSFAFREVLHHLHCKVNMMFIDEIDGGSLDEPGVEAIIKMIKERAKAEGTAIWVISHRPEAVGKFEREILIRKENGFSYIIDNE